MTVPTILTQGATTHVKDGLPVTTVSNLGALTPASEALIMAIKSTADASAKALGIVIPEVSDIQTGLEQARAIADMADKKADQNKDAIDTLTTETIPNLQTSLKDTTTKLDSYITDNNKKVTDLQKDTSDLKTKIDKEVVVSTTLTKVATGEYVLNVSKQNLSSGNLSSVNSTIQLASKTESGLMPKESFEQIGDLTERVESIEQGGVWRETFNTYEDMIAKYPNLDVSSTNWTVNDYVEVEKDSTHDDNATRYIVKIDGEKKSLVFQKVATAKIEQATNEELGVVKGSDNTAVNKYKIFVENDGSMTLIGGKDIDASLSDLQDDITSKTQSLTNTINDIKYKTLPYSSFVGKSVTQYTTCEYEGLIFQAVGDIVEVPATFDSTQWKQIGGRDMELDEVTISKNGDSKLQAIGYVEKNKGESEYQWTGTYAEWVEGRNNGTIPDEWICKITDDYNTDDNRKTFRSILELWWSYSTDDYQDGAYCADGREFYKSDFKSEDESSNPYNKIVEQGRGITYEQYQQTLDTYGFCGAFAIDTVNEKFRLPTIKNCYIRAGESIGETLDQSVPNIVATWNDMGVEDGTGSGAITYKRFDLSRYSHVATIYNTRGGFELDASKYNSAYKDGADVLPYSVVLKPMIQLINYIPKDVSIDFVANMERTIQELKAVVTTLNAKVVEVSNSFIPDYSKKTAITSGYVTQEKGAFQLNCNSYSSTPHVYFDGVEVWTGCLYSNERMQSNCFLTVKEGVAITWSATNNSSLNAYFIPFETQPQV